jgi:hypothetical protein
VSAVAFGPVAGAGNAAGRAAAAAGGLAAKAACSISTPFSPAACCLPRDHDVALVQLDQPGAYFVPARMPGQDADHVPALRARTADAGLGVVAGRWAAR